MSSGGRTFQNGDYSPMWDGLVYVPKGIRHLVKKEDLVDGCYIQTDWKDLNFRGTKYK